MTPDWLIAFIAVPVASVAVCAVLVYWTGRADKLGRAKDAARLGRGTVPNR